MSPDGSVHGWRDERPAPAVSERPAPAVSAIIEGVTGAELKRLRERAKLSHAKLAARAKAEPIICQHCGTQQTLTKRTLIRWEAGEWPIPKLAALGLKALLTK
jgi:helix-turn-helix protein